MLRINKLLTIINIEDLSFMVQFENKTKLQTNVWLFATDSGAPGRRAHRVGREGLAVADRLYA